MPLFRVVAKLQNGRRIALKPDTLRVDVAAGAVIVVSRATPADSVDEAMGDWTAALTPTAARAGDLRPPRAWSFATRAAREARPSPTVDPIRLHATDGYTVGSCRWFSAPDQHERTVIVKRVYSIGTGVLEPLQDAALDADLFLDEDDAHSPLVKASDFAPVKRRVDILVRGTAHARPGADHALVRLTVADVDHTVVALSPRRWDRLGVPAADKPFEPVPLTWCEAYGGAGLPTNPCGTGHAGESPPPRLENPNGLLTSKEHEVEPTCFAPLSPLWDQRRRHLGHFDNAWRDERWPAMPSDFDDAFFQAAPERCRAHSVPPGARLTLTSVRPDGGDLSFALPTATPIAFMARGDSEPTKLPLQLDTIVVDADALMLELVWRGRYSIAQRPRQLEQVLVKAGPETDDIAFAFAFDDAWDEKAPPLDTTRPTLVRSSLARLTKQADMSEPASAQGAAPKPADALLTMLSKGAPVRGRDFAECDLAGADLSGADLTGVLLTGADLTGASLVGAKLTRAQLSGVRATGARFDEADLGGADLTRAVLDDATFASARVDRASFAFARMTGCNLRGATGRSTSFVAAALHRACLDGIDLPKADFSRAELGESSFRGARLVDAKLYECSAAGACFEGAELAHARLELMVATGASFRAAVAAHSNWERATLTHCDFGEATLDSAIFAGADLSASNLSRARAPHASFMDASLNEARLVETELGGAVLEAADLSTATLAGADLRGAELWLARLEGSNLEDAQIDEAGELRRRRWAP